MRSKCSRYSLILLIILSGFNSVYAQDAGKAITVRGYLTSMQSAIFEDFDSEWTNDNLVHNRLNFKVYTATGLSFGMEMRNRVFTGDMVRLNPEYSDMMNKDNGWLDMSWNVIDKQSLLFNSFIDRLWLDYSGSNFQIRVGRQRINWGQTFVWNPNDVFNAYSYFDFDYPERPGSDAIRLQIFPTYSSTIELAAKLDSDENLSAAALYRFNSWGYDIQFIGGYVSGSDWLIGAGWSGSMGSTSFRGELSWFQPEKNFSDTTGTGLFTIGFDRSFSNNWMMQVEVMYCNSPLDLTDFGAFFNGDLSAKDLAFSKFSLFTAVQIPISPLLNLGLSSIIYPELNGYFAGPSIEASLSENIDMSFFWQHFKADIAGEESKMNLAFLRVKYSF